MAQAPAYDAILSEALHQAARTTRARAAVRNQRLRALLRIAVTASPWHARRLAGLRTSRITADDLGSLPLMRRTDLQHAWDEIIVDSELTLAGARAHLERVHAAQEFALYRDRYVVVESSGSSGQPVIVPWDVRELLEATAVGDVQTLANWDLAGLGASPRVAWLHAQIPSALAFAMTHLTNGLSRNGRGFSVATIRSRLLRDLERFNPDVLSGYAGMIAELAVAQTDGELRIAPSLVCTYGETIPDGARKLIADAFGAPVYDMYSCAECGAMAIQGIGEPGMTVLGEKVILEVLPVEDDAKMPSVAVTNLFNTRFPIIRYVLDDVAEIVEAGKADTQIHVRGREGGVMRLQNGLVHKIQLANVVAGVEGVIDFTIHSHRGAIAIDYVGRGVINEDQLIYRLMTLLRGAGIASPEEVLAIRRVSSLGSGRVGKRQRVASL